MHPPYTEEKAFAQRYAEGGASATLIAERLQAQFDLGAYEAETIARDAVQFAGERITAE